MIALRQAEQYAAMLLHKLWPLKDAAEMTSRLRKNKKSQHKQDQSHAQQGLLGSGRKCKDIVQRKYHRLDRQTHDLAGVRVCSTFRVRGEFEVQTQTPAPKVPSKGELE